MKKIAVLLIMLSTSIIIAQSKHTEEKVKYEKQGALVKATFFYENGKVEQEGFFKDKKLHGTWNYFNKTGKKIATGNYNNGLKTGKWLFWSAETLKEVNFENYKIASVNEWTDNALVVKNEE